MATFYLDKINLGSYQYKCLVSSDDAGKTVSFSRQPLGGNIVTQTKDLTVDDVDNEVAVGPQFTLVDDLLYTFSFTSVVTASPGTLVQEYTFTYTAQSSSVDSEITVDIPASRMRVLDTSSYPSLEGFQTPSVTRSGTIERPGDLSSLNYPNNAHFYVFPLHVGTWTFSYTTNVNYSLEGSGNFVVYREGFYNIKTQNISVENGMCCMYSALKETYTRYNNAKCKNTELADRYADDLNKISNLFSLAYNAVACNHLADISEYVTEAKSIANTSLCSCSGDASDGDLVLDILGYETVYAGTSSDEAQQTDVTINSTTLEVTESPANTFSINFDNELLNTAVENSTSFADLVGQITNINQSITNISSTVDSESENLAILEQTVTNLQSTVDGLGGENRLEAHFKLRISYPGTGDVINSSTGYQIQPSVIYDENISSIGLSPSNSAFVIRINFSDTSSVYEDAVVQFSTSFSGPVEFRQTSISSSSSYMQIAFFPYYRYGDLAGELIPGSEFAYGSFPSLIGTGFEQCYLNISVYGQITE